MSRTIVRSAAVVAAVSLSLVGAVVAASSVSADPSVNSDSPTVATLDVSATPVDPQPVIAGREGDTLMQVNVAMAAKAVKQAKGKKRGR